MWASVVIAMLGVWLLMGPFIFSSTPYSHWSPDLLMGSLFVIAGLSNCYFKHRALSLIQASLALLSLIYGYFFFDHVRPGFAQNHIGIGLLVLMFAVLPPKDKTLAETSSY